MLCDERAKGVARSRQMTGLLHKIGLGRQSWS
jgi:hypothetical protein